MGDQPRLDLPPPRVEAAPLLKVGAGLFAGFMAIAIFGQASRESGSHGVDER